MSEWISVKDRLPEPYDHCLGFIIIPNSRGGGYHTEIREISYQNRDVEKWNVSNAIVTHWMPLPEPPKEEK